MKMRTKDLSCNLLETAFRGFSNKSNWCQSFHRSTLLSVSACCCVLAYGIHEGYRYNWRPDLEEHDYSPYPSQLISNSLVVYDVGLTAWCIQFDGGEQWFSLWLLQGLQLLLYFGANIIVGRVFGGVRYVILTDIHTFRILHRVNKQSWLVTYSLILPPGTNPSTQRRTCLPCPCYTMPKCPRLPARCPCCVLIYRHLYALVWESSNVSAVIH
jgi:hypothetical protein